MMCEWVSRTALLLGTDGIAALANASVTVCGLGGVGAAACEALARSGIGRLTLIDFDTIALSNINRQLPALTSTVGRLKTQVMAERIQQINPACKTYCIDQRLTAENTVQLLSGADWVVDAIDDIPGKIAIICYCKKEGIGIVSSMGTGNKVHPEQLKLADLSDTSVCPLARHMRQQLRKVGIDKGVTVVYSQESPLPLKEKLPVGERTIGSVAFVPPVAGYLLAGYVVRQITGLT